MNHSNASSGKYSRYIKVFLCALVGLKSMMLMADVLWGSWAQNDSAFARVDTRESFGGALVHGVETLGSPDGLLSTQWDTATLTDGWHTQTSGTRTAAFAVINSSTIAIEEGRLATNTTWTADAVHLLRNHVVIPKDVTLTVNGGSIIKLTEDAQIVVEDGGKLIINDSAGGDVSFAQAEDDSIGGDTDMHSGTADWSTRAVRKFSSGTVIEHGYVALNGDGAVTLDTFITVSLNDAQCMRHNGKTYIPVTFSGSRNAPFSIDWVAEPGTALFGTDYTLASGSLEWTSTSQGTKYIEIPLLESGDQEAKAFTVRIVATRGINVDKNTATVTIVNKEPGEWVGEWTEGSSAITRVETRATFGGSLVHGVETLGSHDGASLTQWDTTTLTNGWHTQTSGTLDASLAVINSSTIAIEEGRLATNTTWGADAVHLLRNHVVIPNGMTLTINGGSIIKLTEDTQIVVEDGGKLIINDSIGNDVWFTQAEDDTIGGDTDMRSAPADWQTTAVRKFPSGTITEHGYVALSGNGVTTLDTFIPISLNDAQVMRESGKAFVPVTFTGSRNAAFSIDWTIEPGTATFGTDYTQASGTLSWTSTSQGTKYIEVPLAAVSQPGSPKTFTVNIMTSRGVNVAQRTATVTILDSIIELTQEQLWAGITDSPPARVDTREGYGGRLVHGVETIGEPNGATVTQWDTTTLADGWHSQSRGDQTVSLSVINSPSASIEEGRIVADATWTTDTVHVVRNRVVVPSGVTLTIANGAIVKFTEDTGILVEIGGTLIANGVTFTHIADDTVGGDTNADDNRSLPLNDQYTIEGAGQLQMADCDFRHRTVVLQQSGTLTGGQIWQGNCVYRITGDITIPSGASLTILEGAIIKFDAGKRIKVQQGGTIRVAGSRNKKVIFTSIKDDIHGGDTNKDGLSSIPSMGDWGDILLDGGSGEFTYADFLYGGGVNGNQYGARANVFIWNNGRGTFKGCSFIDGAMDGCFAQNATFENCIFIGNDRGLVSNTNQVTATNCVFYQNGVGFVAHTGSLVVKNSITAFNFRSGGNSDGSSLSVQYTCFWNPTATGGNTYLSGAGNFVADPLYKNINSEDFTLKAGSPCIDAADSTLSPATDYFGLPRVSDPYITPKGIPDSKGVYADIGAFEYVNINASSDIDLAATSVSGPASASAGDFVQVAWRVINVGTKVAAGSWQDSVYLQSADPQITTQSVLMGTKAIADSIQPGETREFTANFKLPAVQSGQWAYKVCVNSNRGVFEGALVDNNTLLSSALLTITAPLMQSGLTNVTLAPSESQVYRLDSIPDTGAVIILPPSSVSGFVGSGYTPNSSRYDYSITDLGNGTSAIVIPPGANTSNLYLNLQNQGTDSVAVSVTINPLELKLYSIGTRSVANTGKYVISLVGTGMDDVASAWISLGGNSYQATAIEHISNTQVAARFELNAISSGNYDVSVSNDIGGTSVLEAALAVSQTAAAKFYAHIEMPSGTRAGRENLAYFVYGNSGNAEMPAPYVSIRAGRYQSVSSSSSTPNANPGNFTADPNLYMRFGSYDAWQNGDLELMALSTTYPVSVLKPGEERRIPIFYKYAGTGAFSSVSLSYSYVSDSNTDTIPWDNNGLFVRPAWASDDAWTLMLANLKASVGQTWKTYFDKLRTNFDYLASMGYATYKLADAWQMEVGNAVAPRGQPKRLVATTDIGIDARGGAIGLSRVYSPSFRKRFTSGIFGYGWEYNYEYSAQYVDSQKLLTIYTPFGGALLFVTNSTVSGVRQWSPFSEMMKISLTENASTYTLKDKLGSVIALDKTTGRILSTTDSAGNAVTFQYTGSNLTKVSHSDGRHLRLDYSGGTVSKITDDQGRSVSYVYSNGSLVEVKNNISGNSVFYSYNVGSAPKGKALSQIRYADSSTLDFVYDNMGRVGAISRNANEQTILFSYDTSYLCSLRTANGGHYKNWYGPNGEILASQDALGGVAKYKYNTDTGNLLSVEAPNGNVSRMEYDQDGNLAATISPSGYVTEFAHNDMGLLSSFTDARGNSVKYESDTRGNTVAIAYADGSSELFVYDAANQITASTNRRGQTITYENDSMGRLIKKTYPDGRRFDYTYNSNNQILTASDTLTGAISFGYDSKNRLQTINYPGSKSFTYQYDAIGRLAKRTSEDGFELVYSYSADGKLISLADKNGKEYIHYTYDATTGWVSEESRGNGTKTGYSYDITGQIEGIKHIGNDSQVMDSFAYAYDKNYQIASVASNVGKTSYSYDTEGQLLSATNPDSSIATYSYDSVGNRLIAEGTQYITNNLNQYTAIGSDSLLYDNDGNLIKQGSTKYDYDIENRLIKITRQDGTIWECQYDATGSRINITDNGNVRKFVSDYQGFGNLNAEYDADGALIRRYVYSDSLAAEETPSGVRQYYHFDMRGDTRILTDDAGSASGTSGYDVFGALVSSTGQATSLGFVGACGINNDGSGLLFMRNRYYSAQQGRFIQADPIGLNGADVSFYRYCLNSPLRFVDPHGLTLKSIAKKTWGYADEFRGYVDDTVNNLGNSIIGSFYRDTFDRAAGGFLGHFGTGEAIGASIANKDSALKASIRIGVSVIPGGPSDKFEILETFNKYQGTGREKYLEQDVTEALMREAFGGRMSSGAGSGRSYSVTAIDPNEIAGSYGYGNPETERFVVSGEWLDFKIYFENISTASAAAQEIRVASVLSSQLDLLSFEFGEVTLGSQTDMSFSGKKSGEYIIAQKGTSYKIKMNFSLDEQTGVLSCYLRSWDANQARAGYWPEDIFAGILPPNDESGRGEGHIAFRVKVKANATDRARIDTSAEIIFDNNEPITTDPAWFNTVYADGPTEPIITTQPSSVTMTTSSTASFSVVATGYAPLSYQWYKDGVALDDKTAATLSLSNVTAADAGSYTVAVSNIFKTVTSQAATLSLGAPPVIEWVVGSQTAHEGVNATFTVRATAGTAPFTYKWYKNNTFLPSANTMYCTAPAPTLADNGSIFKVEVINSAGTASLNATLTVVANPTTQAQQIKAQLEAPGAATITISGTVDFSLLVGGVTLTSGKSIVGADANSTIVGGVTIANGASNVVILGVNFDSGGLNINDATDVYVSHCTFADAPVVVTGSANNVSFSWNEFTATSAGSGSAMRITGSGTTGILLDHNFWGAGLKTDMPAVTNARVVMFNNYFEVTGNTTATIAGVGAQILSMNNIYQGVNNPLTKQNGGLLRTLGNFTTSTSGSTASGDDKVFVPGYSHLMHSAGLDVPGAEALVTLITTHAGNTAGKNSEGPSTTSGDASISATVTGSGASKTATTAYVPALGGFTLTANVTGFTPNASSRQWYRDNFAIASATAATHTVAAANATDHAGAYAVSMTTSAGEIVTSGAFNVTVGTLAAPVITAHPSSQTITVGNTVTFNVTATGESLNYQWLKSGATISNATNSSYTITDVAKAHAGSYSVRVSNPSGTVTSSIATLTVNTSSTGGNDGGGGGAVSFVWFGVVFTLFALRKVTRRGGAA